MRKLLALSAIIFASTPVMLPAGANAQEFEYNCQNEPLDIAIPGGRLDEALQQLRLQTRCPISGTKLARGKKSKPVVGNMVPEEALQALLNGTGLEEQPIKGGFQIVRTRRF